MLKYLLISFLSLSLYGETMITAGSGARMRTEPKTKGKTIVSLPVGELVEVVNSTMERQEIGKLHNYWYQVKHNEKTGWIYGASLLPFEAKHQNYIYRHIILDRLAKKRSYAEYADTAKFVKKLQQRTADRNFWLELEHYRMELINHATMKLQMKNRSMKHPWYKEHKDELFYHELAGGHYPNAQYVWKLVDKYKTFPAADRLAYYASTLMLGGECEGMAGCYIGREILTTGEYLKRFPAGKYHKHALNALSNFVKNSKSDIISQKKEDKKFIEDNLKDLLKIVKKSPKKEATPIIKQIEELIQK